MSRRRKTRNGRHHSDAPASAGKYPVEDHDGMNRGRSRRSVTDMEWMDDEIIASSTRNIDYIEWT